MTYHRVRSSFPACVALVALLAVSPSAARTQTAAEKTVFVSIVDAANAAVKDFTAAEIAVREDNIDREVVGIKLSTQPLVIQLLADTTSASAGGMMAAVDRSSGGTELIRDIRSSLSAFVKAVSVASPETQFGLMEFGQASIQITKFTTTAADVEKGITRLFPKPDAGSVLLEGMLETNKTFAKVTNVRRAMVILNVEPGDEQSKIEQSKIIPSFRDGGASIWVVSLQRGQLRNPTRDLVLNQLTKITGGQREFIVGPSGLSTMLLRYASWLTSMYEVTYKRPAGPPPVQVQVGSRRADVTLRNIAFAPK